MEGDRQEDLRLVHGDHPRADRLLEAVEDILRAHRDLGVLDDQIHMGLLEAPQVEAQQCLSQLARHPCTQARGLTLSLITPAA